MTRYVPCASSELCSRVRNHRKRFSLVGGACRLRWCDPRPGAEPCHTPMMHAMHRWRQPQVAKCEPTRLVSAAMVGPCAACANLGGRKENSSMQGSVRHLNPDGLHKNPAYSQAVVVNGNVKTVYVGGQNAVDAAGAVVGKGDIGAQTEQGAAEHRDRPSGRRRDAPPRREVERPRRAGAVADAGLRSVPARVGQSAQSTDRHRGDRGRTRAPGFPRGDRRDRGRPAGLTAPGWALSSRRWTRARPPPGRRRSRRPGYGRILSGTVRAGLVRAICWAMEERGSGGTRWRRNQ